MSNNKKWPGVSEAYRFVEPSYGWALNRIDAANSRLQALLSLSASLALGFPVLVKAVYGSATFDSPLFWVGVVLFGVVFVLGIVGKGMGKVDLVDLNKLYDDWLADDPDTFRGDMLAFAAEHQETNTEATRRKKLVEQWMAGLLALQVATWLLWFSSVS